jgi:D-hydroxyproline dehydrogenase
MTSPKTAQVIGGGIIGLNVALALQERGVAVHLVEMEPEGRPASWGNAGHIAVEQVEPLASFSSIRSLPSRLFANGGAAAFPLAQIHNWLPFGLRLLNASRPSRFVKGKNALTALLAHALPAWQRRMIAMSCENMLKSHGHIIAWESDHSARQGRAHWSSVGTGTANWRDVDASEACQLEELVRRPIADAIRFEGSAQLADPGEVLKALENAFMNNGGVIAHRAAVLDATTLNDAELSIVCAGVHSAKLLKPLGHRVPIIAERGYHIQADISDWPFSMPPVVFEDRSLIAARFWHGLRVSSFVEFASAHTAADPRKWERLHKHVAALGLPFFGEASHWMGCRPTLPDYLPAIGRSRHDPRIIYAFGHQHLGLTLGPLTGELAASVASGDQPLVDISPFSLDRFERKFA